MSRTPRLKIDDETAVYHIMFRTALDGFPLGDIEKEREKDYEISWIDRFMYCYRYFADSGIIGTKGFVSRNYRRFKDKFMSKREKIPKPVAGLDGIFSLERLVE